MSKKEPVDKLLFLAEYLQPGWNREPVMISTTARWLENQVVGGETSENYSAE